MNLNELSIKEAQQGLQKKEFSSEELTKACLSQVQNKDQKIQAFITLTEGLALAQARKVDEKRVKGEKLAILEGLPCAVKDNILVRGVRTTAGSKILENYQAPYDATVTQKLKNQGLVLLGKTNLDEFAMGSSTENSYFGPTRNPWNFARVPGGSSGGSAAAVAADECIYALGSDTGGSVRQPASFCGVVGLKPSYGRVSRYGLMAMASSLDQIGPLTKRVEDAALVLEVISGNDEYDSTTKETKFQAKIKKPIKGLRVGIPREYFIEGMDEEVRKSIQEAIKKLEELGAKVQEVSLPHTKYALACYYIIMPAEVSANLARYDGMKYGYSVVDRKENLLNVYLRSRGEGLGGEVRRRIMLGTYTLSAGYYEAYYLKAQKVRTLIRQDFDKAFKKADCLVTATSPTLAFKLGEKFNDPLTMYLADIYTVSVNVAGLPAISLPCGFGQPQDGGGGVLPIGLQIVGRNFDEETILGVAWNYEQATSWHQRKPFEKELKELKSKKGKRARRTKSF